MQIVTLTTDFGHKDYYQGLLKGAILSKTSTVQLVDISHDIESYDIVHGAFVLKNAFAAFPKGTIHLILVTNSTERRQKFLAFEYKGHYFLGPDNGLFSLVLEKLPKEVVRLPFSRRGSFPLKDLFAKAIEHIAAGKPLVELGNPVKEIQTVLTLQPVIMASQIRGTVVYIDKYENVVVNISKKLFEKVGQGRSFALQFKRHEPITDLSRYYSDVGVGEPLCLFNSADLLEIALNMDKAASMLDLKVDDSVHIDFIDS